MRTLSLIICAYSENRWSELQAAVASAKNQSRLPDEIIVVIDNNPSLFQRAAKQLDEATIIENKYIRGLSGARNSGIAIATGELIVFMDEDAVAERNWLENLDRTYNDLSIMGVGGAILPLWEGSKPAWFPNEFNWVVGCTYRGLPENISSIRNLIGCNMSFRTEVFRDIGGFRSGIGRVGTLPFGCEETELCIRASQRLPGRKFVYEPRARVLHHVRENRRSFGYFLSRCYAEGISKALVTFAVGKQDGLSTERSYTMKVLPEGMLRGIRDALFDQDFSGFGRAGAILSGFICTAFGFLTGKLSLFFRRKSFHSLKEEVEFM